MSFVKTPEYLAQLKGFKPQFFDAESIAVFWETTPECIARLLPPPLKPSKFPLVYSSIQNNPSTNFKVSYLEGGLSLACEYDGEVGFHCIANPVTDDMAMIGGREQFGYPKKMAQISFDCSGKSVEAWIERHGIRFFHVNAKLGGKLNESDAMAILGPYLKSPMIVYAYKHFMAPDGCEHINAPFDYSPRLIREELTVDLKQMDAGEVELHLASSDYDPWIEVEVVRVLGGVHMKFDATMEPGKVVAEVDPVEFLPYSHMKIDPMF